MATKAQNIKKLSVKTVCGAVDLKKLINAPESKLALMRVVGSAVGVSTGTSTFGDWTALQGVFEATNLETGQVFSSSTLFLPDVALTPLRVALSSPGARGVEFALDVGVKYVENSKGGVPYEYTWEALLPPDESDPVTRIKAKLLALAAPAGDKPADDKPGTKAGKAGK